MLKKQTALIISLVMMLGLFSQTVFASTASTNAKLVIDGTEVSYKGSSAVSGSTALLPLNVLADAVGIDATVDSANKKYELKNYKYTIGFTPDSKKYTVNGNEYEMPAAPQAKDGTLLVPVEALTSIGADASFDAKTNTATVKYFSKMTGKIKVSGSTTVQPIMQAAADNLIKLNKGFNVAVAGGGSGAGIKDTINGANNVGMSSRALTADEAKQLQPVVVAHDGIAIIVNPKNPVTNLTKAQAAKIFMGEIKNWKDVGGNDAPIMVQTRETGSGTLATLEEMLLEKKNVVKSATPNNSSALIKQAVAKDANAIGFDSVGFIDQKVKALTLDGIEASEQNIKSTKYPMSRDLIVFTKSAPKNEIARLLEYLRSSVCQNTIIAKEGYVTIR